MRDCPKAYDVHYMMLEEKETWIEQHLTAADVAAVDTLSEILETPEALERLLEDLEQGFTSQAGEQYAPAVIQQPLFRPQCIFGRR